MNDQSIVLALLATASTVTRRLDGSLSMTRGISFSEYQLLAALRDHPGGAMTRVDLAAAVGLSPSGVTRALQPLEKLGFLETTRDQRDARKSLAALTPAGNELVRDAQAVVEDTIAGLGGLEELTAPERERFVRVLSDLGAG